MTLLSVVAVGLLTLGVNHDLLGVDHELIGASVPSAVADVSEEAETIPPDATTEQVYSAARRKHLRTGRPLLVLFGSATCGPCKRARGIMSEVEVPQVYVEVEASPELTAEVLGKMPAVVPVLVVYESPNDKPRSAVYTGQGVFDYLATQSGKGNE